MKSQAEVQAAHDLLSAHLNGIEDARRILANICHYPLPLLGDEEQRRLLRIKQRLDVLCWLLADEITTNFNEFDWELNLLGKGAMRTDTAKATGAKTGSVARRGKPRGV